MQGFGTTLFAEMLALTTGEAYRELGDDYNNRQDPDRQARRLTRQLEHLGYTVDISPAA